jgi:hypothetical protein
MLLFYNSKNQKSEGLFYLEKIFKNIVEFYAGFKKNAL